MLFILGNFVFKYIFFYFLIEIRKKIFLLKVLSNCSDLSDIYRMRMWGSSENTQKKKGRIKRRKIDLKQKEKKRQSW